MAENGPNDAESDEVTGAPVAEPAGAVEHMPTAECWRLLEETPLGRLALVRADGTPDIFPVNYLTHEGSLYIRTARDSKLLHIAHHPVAAFEIDGETEATRWSVVVRGPIGRVDDDAELRESGVRRLRSWSPTHKLFAIKLTAQTVTGRRFAKTGGRAGPALAFESSAAPPVPPNPSREQARAERPTPIPHRTPAADGPAGDGPAADGPAGDAPAG
ncbi:pyridoxamine 5'-phosphate oxidase family protein [Microbacterium cremeum]|uniref:pyridoxamine 5'-phosphate oxidase family protein n=1 Tax=Microbacterium cremeum TaxID=2782169 RepID=UPI00188852E7|nr:pyridoxamine 5'-phosphate oxidase family protein [Microbacterium cremeum]